MHASKRYPGNNLEIKAKFKFMIYFKLGLSKPSNQIVFNFQSFPGY